MSENNILTDILNDTEIQPNSNLAEHHRKFFETGIGEYGEGDKFIGFSVPQVRNLEKKYRDRINFDNINLLLHNEIHEFRLLALIYLTNLFGKNINLRDKIVKIYLKNTSYINNWDLVDLSCYKIIGRYCFDLDNYDIIFKLSRSNNLWEERISIVSTMYPIWNGKFDLTLELCEYFLNHKHHLIHKACGWVLREVGKKDEEVLLDFIKNYSNRMPKIMLSYASERIKMKSVKR